MTKWDGKGERPDGFRFEELDDTELARICEKSIRDRNGSNYTYRG